MDGGAFRLSAAVTQSAHSSGEKQAATHVSLDQEYDADLAAVWQRLEEQLVAAANRGVVPVNFQPTQYCLNSQTQNLRQPLAVMEGEGPQEELCWSCSLDSRQAQSPAGSSDFGPCGFQLLKAPNSAAVDQWLAVSRGHGGAAGSPPRRWSSPSPALCVSAEPIIVEVTFRNPLKVSLALSNLSLLWSFSHEDGAGSGETLAGEGAVTNEEGLTPAVGQARRTCCSVWDSPAGFHALTSSPFADVKDG